MKLRIDISTDDHHVRDEVLDVVEAILLAHGVRYSYTYNPESARPLTIHMPKEEEGT